MVDMFIEVEQSVSMTYMATIKVDESAAERAKAVSAMKVRSAAPASSWARTPSRSTAAWA
jgi:hypothetical protein